MGISASWMRVAEVIGADAFLAMWRVLDADPSFRTDNGDLRLHLRPYRSYLRYQRNRYIEQLAAGGASAKDIRESVKLNLCERISLRHISRILSEK